MPVSEVLKVLRVPKVLRVHNGTASLDPRTFRNLPDLAHPEDLEDLADLSNS
jgi:hypothetical protein